MPNVRSETETNINLGKRRIWVTHVNWMWIVFHFKTPWSYQIWTVKCVYSQRDDFPEILGKTKTQDCKKSTYLARKSPGLLCFEFFDNIPA